jgi:hypothetical protein
MSSNFLIGRLRWSVPVQRIDEPSAVISRLFPFLLALVAFVVTLAIENWPRPDPAHPSRRSAIGIATNGLPAHEPPAGGSSFVGGPVDPAAPKQPPTGSGLGDSRSAQAGVQPAQSDEEPAPPDPAQEPVPVLIQLERPTAQSAETVATFQNQGSKHLKFTISTIDSTGAIHSTIEMSAPPHRWESLNERGLLILPGDQIVVRSPPYQDYTVSTN